MNTRRSGWIVAVALMVTTAAPAATPPAANPSVYDVVIAGGRGMDPESGLDAIRDVGIRDGKVRAVSREPLTGRRRIDARGLVGVVAADTRP